MRVCTLELLYKIKNTLAVACLIALIDTYLYTQTKSKQWL